MSSREDIVNGFIEKVSEIQIALDMEYSVLGCPQPRREVV